MKIRLCDSCGEEIKDRVAFVKCCKSMWDGKKQMLLHIGDICMKCWEEHTKKK